MKFEKFRYENVTPAGEIDGVPGVITSGAIRFGMSKQGPFFSVCLPRTDKGDVEGIIVYLDKEGQIDELLREGFIQEAPKVINMRDRVKRVK